MTAANMPRWSPLREDGAQRILDAIDDPFVRSLITLCLAQARMRFIRGAGEGDVEFDAHLPVEPFDMEFFVSVLRSAFSNKVVIERLLAGETLEVATGWDV